jgi:hypothetical protein
MPRRTNRHHGHPSHASRSGRPSGCSGWSSPRDRLPETKTVLSGPVRDQSVDQERRPGDEVDHTPRFDYAVDGLNRALLAKGGRGETGPQQRFRADTTVVPGQRVRPDHSGQLAKAVRRAGGNANGARHRSDSAAQLGRDGQGRGREGHRGLGGPGPRGRRGREEGAGHTPAPGAGMMRPLVVAAAGASRVGWRGGARSR